MREKIPRKVNALEKNIRKRIFFLLLMGMLILILSFTFIFFSYFSRIYRDQLEEEQKNTASGTADTVQTLLMNIRQNAYYLCCNEDLADVLVNSQDNVTNRQIESLSHIFSLNTGTPTAPLMQSAYPILLVDRQFPLSNSAESFQIGRNMSQQHIYTSEGLEEEEWYRQTLSMRGQIYAFCDERNRDCVFFSHLLRSVRIADPRYNENIGVVLYAMPTIRLNALLASPGLNEQSSAVLLYGNTVMASTDQRLFPTGQNPAWMADFPETGSMGKLQLDHTQYSVTRASFQRDWQCVLFTPNHSAVFMKAPIYMLALMLFLLVTVLLLFSFILSRQMIRPIVRLSGIMEQAKDAEHMPYAEEPDKGDEITVLYRSYNAMRGRIQSLSLEAKEEQRKHRASELKMMQAQINPHFIYNTLDSISCSALMEGNDDIVTMVASLINILKYSINFSRTTVPLREEINYLEDYICIQQIRSSDGFSFAYDIPEKYMSVCVSPIILQPLVENSIFHAKKQDERLSIRLYCEEKDGCLLIHVTDNGSSGDPEKINSFLAGDELADEHGIGIRNVYRRITLLSGDRGDLRYARMPEGGLDAVIQIPLDNSPSDGSSGSDKAVS